MRLAFRQTHLYRFVNMAERVGFEPTVPLPVHLISSQGRYNHFDTAPYVCCSLSIIAGTGSKIKEIFRRFTCV